MALFRQLTGKVTSQLTDAVSDMFRKATGASNPYDVQELTPQVLSKLTTIRRDNIFFLHKDASTFYAVLFNPSVSTKAFCLFQLTSEHEANTTFSNFSFKFGPLCAACPRTLFDCSTLQKYCNSLRSNPTWTSAHLAAHHGLVESFRSPPIAHQINAADETTQVTPIMLAVESGNLSTVQELIICGVQLNLADNQGDNVFHYAAKCENATVIQYLASKDPSAVNQLNLFGESPMHRACLSDRPDNVEHLLRWGGKPELTMSGRYPIHCAMKTGSEKCVETLCRWSREQLHVQDGKYGGTPLHWAKNRKCVYVLADLGCNLESQNKAGETALHIMVKKDRSDCVMGLLAKGADAMAIGSHGNNALHHAIIVNNLQLVQTLIVFGSDINQINHSKQSPRHCAAISTSCNRDQMIYLLHCVGASRCMPGLPQCTNGCISSGTFDGVPVGKLLYTPEHQKKFYDSVDSEASMAAAMTRTASASGSSIMTCDMLDSPMGSPGERVLCLDGGGIRGLVLIQLLLAIERVTGQPIRNSFDWIGGTSTGGILALAIVHGKSLHYCQGLYFRLKDEVFCGKRPYPSEPLEKFMKKEFGENTRMTEKDYPKVVVTGVLGDRCPAELHLFRNYDPPGVDLARVSEASGFEPPPRPNEQYVWRAARCSGAAPTYFRAFGRFLDGGLMANNPTLDVLTEMHEYGMGLKLAGKGSLVRPIHVVVSLGTGRQPPNAVNACDVYRPEGILDIWKVATGAKNLGQLLIEQATQAEGRPVERARAWCSMIGVPFYRLSPQLSEDIPLDCHDDSTLIKMLWETQCYLYQNMEKIQQMSVLLRP